MQADDNEELKVVGVGTQEVKGKDLENMIKCCTESVCLFSWQRSVEWSWLGLACVVLLCRLDVRYCWGAMIVARNTVEATEYFIKI